MVLVTIVTVAYKPTYNWGGHIVYIYIYYINPLESLVFSMVDPTVLGQDF